MKNYKIAYVVSDLKRVGPSNQTLNIIRNSNYKNESMVITLFKEPDDTMIEEYKNNNIYIECLNLDRIGFIINGKKILSNILKKYQIKLVHSYGIKPDCLCVKVCKKINLIHVITLRNYPREDILTRMSFIKGRIALHNHLKALLSCDNVVCCSKTIYEKMSKDYPNKEFSYIQNGVDIDKYKKVNHNIKNELREKYHFDKNKIIYISTGSFIPRKRIEETINGFIESKNDGILLLLGDGFLFNDLKNKYQADNVVFFGKSSNVAEMLQLSDYFISSSESEGLPNGVIEAISCGLPVILSDIPQHLEILSELKNAGLSYELGNIKELGKVINKFDNFKFDVDISDSPFTMTNMSKKYVNYYTKVGEKND